MKQNGEIEQNVWDAIMERPYGFTVAGERFLLFPVTLGKSMLLSRLMQKLNIQESILKLNPAIESLRIARKEKETACRIISLCTTKDKDNLFDEPYISGKADFFSKNLSSDEIAQLLLVIFSHDYTDSFISYYGLDKERKDQEKIARVKNKGGNTVTFGGKSPYGTIVGAACERFGWSVEYVIWGISYTNLRMLLADAVNSVYLSDEEKKAARIHAGEEVLNMNDPKSWERIKSMKWD